ncbi:armadillo-type protein [Naematelia encephala]|uniref:Armadillo-type protein n=1 Tax=Naematelia encephala TaxID=71784 RepID=A0A1Y2BB54_9TREE|nr:armadillo-type protein [Naematelia encephala]
MTTTGTDQATSAVLQALHTLYHDPDSSSKKRANEWLEEFQHSVEAWQTCHTLLTSPESPLEGRLFSAQTLRAKILYDLSQLPREQLPPLRDSLLSSLSPLTQPGAPVGSRAVLTQLCLALSDLALQMPEWPNVVGGMIEQYGKDPSTVTILLGFVKALVEEEGHPRLPIYSNEARAYVSNLLGNAAEQVTGVLSMYIQAAGITVAIQTAVFDTLRSWLQGGHIVPIQVAQTPLFPSLFDALASDQLFDSAVDCLCDLIHETQEVEDNVQVVEQVVSRLLALRPQLDAHKEDPDRIRGYCRLYCEAGECYKDLIMRHPQDLFPLVEAILVCSEYPDLDIVPITFNFWYTLATALASHTSEPAFAHLLESYARLQTVIISHLHFPRDDEPQTAQERDEFRLFRHRMGDTLKDCCHVLGATACLRKSYDLVVAALAKGSPSWQEIEAPLFSMRSMGAEVDPDDDEIIPHIMEILPKLPDHPRIRYAAILVISRYTQWTDRHPLNLAFQLQYISAGFDMADEEVSAAAAQAMKFMCQDCNQHLVPFLPQLHAFVNSVGHKLDQADMVEVCEAIGYVISSMPAEQGAQALQQFCEPLIHRIQVIADAPGEAPRPEMQKTAEQIDAFLGIIRTLDPVPETCFPTCSLVYSILDRLLARYAKLYFISERVGSLMRRGLAFFPARALEPVVQPVLERMAIAFDETGYASYLWIVGKVTAKFGDAARGPEGETVSALLGAAFERVTSSLSATLQGKVALEIPDVMDDYVHCFMAYLNALPAVLSSPVIPHAVQHTLSALTLPASETIFASLDTLALLSQRLSHAQYQPVLRPVFGQYGEVIAGLTIGGIVQSFPEDSLDQVQQILGATLSCAEPAVAGAWVMKAIESLPGNVLPAVEKQKFVGEVHEHLTNLGTDKLKNALNDLVRAARRAKERGRQARKSLGAGAD